MKRRIEPRVGATAATATAPRGPPNAPKSAHRGRAREQCRGSRSRRQHERRWPDSADRAGACRRAPNRAVGRSNGLENLSEINFRGRRRATDRGARLRLLTLAPVGRRSVALIGVIAGTSSRDHRPRTIAEWRCIGRMAPPDGAAWRSHWLRSAKVRERHINGRLEGLLGYYS